MTDEKTDEKESTLVNTIIMIVTVIGAFILSRFFGFAGVGAAVIGWFAYDYSRKKMGIFIGLVVGFTAGIATYGLAVLGFMSMLS